MTGGNYFSAGQFKIKSSNDHAVGGDFCFLTNANYRYKKKKGLFMKTIEIVYHDDELETIEANRKGDWIDLRSAEDVELKAREFKLISLGVSMRLPKGYEAHIVPRSSTFKNFGIIQTNHMGVIDNSYSGTNDIWKFPAYALRDTVIHKNDRICQFRIVKRQPEIYFEEVPELDEEDRGGFGSTGVN